MNQKPRWNLIDYPDDDGAWEIGDPQPFTFIEVAAMVLAPILTFLVPTQVVHLFGRLDGWLTDLLLFIFN